ncbi:MAG: Re/Si-specific NAD(P)(+) transhydrogenase subunit alpha [Proteobacteria bacterium]|nr:Re/Si-specific NAD(P)(+) transhydrogenase subunit alpha [Pseudomonadota bacterium]
MKLGVPHERNEGERRVAATPASVKKLVGFGFDVHIEHGAGNESSFRDADYIEAGAALTENPWDADVVIKVNPPTLDEVEKLRVGGTLISLVHPAKNDHIVQAMAARGITLLALDQVPRITRAQKMDVLSSMANIAGYRAIVEASNHYPGFFGAQITAAGKSPPAQVLVIGAGVAGLAAIGAARGMGAVVKAFDVRPAVKEQVESMGGQFLMLEFDESGDGGGGYAKTMSDEFIAAEMALFLEQAKQVQVVLTTALIPGRRAPILWTREHVEAMAPGSVIVDLAAANGGNCELTEPGQVVTHNGVTIIGYTDLTSRLPNVASQFFATNLVHLLDECGKADGWDMDMENEVLRGSTVLNKGELIWPPPRKPPPPPKKEEPAEVVTTEPAEVEKPAAKKESGTWRHILSLALAVLFTVIGVWAPIEFIQHVTVFALACFVGWQVVWNVNHALHTPLMSVTNAISGIIIVGGLIQAGTGEMNLAGILGGAAILFASINVAGGFLVTQRMLAMFRRGDA